MPLSNSDPENPNAPTRFAADPVLDLTAASNATTKAQATADCFDGTGAHGGVPT